MFILSELSIANKLFTSIHETLSLLHKGIKDNQSLSDENHELMIEICENQVPFKWRQIWSGPRLLVDYLKASVLRGVAANQRYENASESFEQNIDFSHVFSVETLLSSLKLKNARYLFSCLGIPSIKMNIFLLFSPIIFRELNISACDISLVTSLGTSNLSSQTTKLKVASLYVSLCQYYSIVGI